MGIILVLLVEVCEIVFVVVCVVRAVGVFVLFDVNYCSWFWLCD